MRRAEEAGTPPAKNTQTWPPSPDCERSSAAGIPAARAASRYASASGGRPGPSKSQATRRQVSPRSSGYRPAWTVPARWRSTTSSVKGKYSRSGRLAFAHPPRTAGLHPPLPERWFCHRSAYTSSRPRTANGTSPPCPPTTTQRRHDLSRWLVTPRRPKRVGAHGLVGSAARASNPNNPRRRLFSALKTASSASISASRLVSLRPVVSLTASSHPSRLGSEPRQTCPCKPVEYLGTSERRAQVGSHSVYGGEHFGGVAPEEPCQELSGSLRRAGAMSLFGYRAGLPTAPRWPRLRRQRR